MMQRFYRFQVDKYWRRSYSIKSIMLASVRAAFVNAQFSPCPQHWKTSRVSSKCFITLRHRVPQRHIGSFNVTACAEPPPSSLNVPSGILLGASSVMAISTVGCIFELTSGHPQYGYRLTAAILAASAPAFLFLFSAAIQKGRAEADESWYQRRYIGYAWDWCILVEIVKDIKCLLWNKIAREEMYRLHKPCDNDMLTHLVGNTLRPAKALLQNDKFFWNSFGCLFL